MRFLFSDCFDRATFADNINDVAATAVVDAAKGASKQCLTRWRSGPLASPLKKGQTPCNWPKGSDLFLQRAFGFGSGGWP